MVKYVCLLLSLLVLTAGFAPAAQALLARTQDDLNAVLDRLQYEFGPERHTPSQTPPVTPILVAPPQAYWEESKADFAPAMLDVLARVFPNRGELINCAECFQSRVYMAHDSRLVVQNGELSLADLARLRQQAGYAQAKSILITRETPSGIEVQLLAIDDGRILYKGLVDSTKTLDQAQPPLRLARELDRRERGEALSYINMDLGLYPKSKFQLKFLEQWGSHNQNLSGFVLSAYNPTGALGLTYLYMLPKQRRMTVGVTGYYSLEGMFSSNSPSLAKALSAQLALNYALNGSYGVFLSGDTSGTISAGFSFLNPVLFPFLL